MADALSKPSESRSKTILGQIQTHEHTVLTSSEIADGIDEVTKRQVTRNLKWMSKHGPISSRQLPDGTWLWWVSVDALSAEDTVASARQVGLLLSKLYDARWEFKSIAAGGFLLTLVLSLSFWSVILIVLNIEIVSLTTILWTLVAGYVLATLIIILSLFIFPVETLGDWTKVGEDRSNDTKK